MHMVGKSHMRRLKFVRESLWATLTTCGRTSNQERPYAPWLVGRPPAYAVRACSQSRRVAILASSSTTKPLFPGSTGQDLVCSMEWKEWQQKKAHFAPSEVALLVALDLLGLHCVDGQCSVSGNSLFLAHKQRIPGWVLLEIGELTEGPRPQTAQLPVVPTLRQFAPTGCGYQHG